MEALKNLFNHVKAVAFDANIKRLSIGEFILAGSLMSLPMLGVLLVLAILARVASSYSLYMIGSLIVTIGFLFYWVPVAIKRCNDIGRSKHMLWLLLIPFVNLFVLLYLMLKKGERVDNSFGPDPLARQEVSNSNYWMLWASVFVISIIVNIVITMITAPLMPQAVAY